MRPKEIETIEQLAMLANAMRMKLPLDGIAALPSELVEDWFTTLELFHESVAELDALVAWRKQKMTISSSCFIYTGIYQIPTKRTVPYESVYRHEAMLALLERVENPEEKFGLPVDAFQATWTHPNGIVTIFSFITIDRARPKADEKKSSPKLFHQACLNAINLNEATDEELARVRQWNEMAVIPLSSLSLLLETLPDPER